MEIKVSHDEVKNIIDHKIRLVMAEALGRDPQGLVKAVVESALSKEGSSYSRKTAFQETIDKMIQEEAQAVFRRWIKRKRPIIRDAIEKRMTQEKSEFFEKIANHIVDQLASKFHVSIWLKSDE